MTRFAAILLSFTAALGAAQAQALDKVRFGTNWVAEAEHGGFYQALADGTYKKYGLDVTIVPGGPNVNNRILLPVGKLDFFMSANSLQTFDAVEHNIPTVAVAASFQKDPQVLIAHPGVGKLADLKTHTLFVSKEGMVTYFQWLKADFGFDEFESEALHLQRAAVPRRQEFGHGGLRHLRALRDRKAGALQAGRVPARRSRLQQLFDADRDAARSGRQAARSGAALRRCLGHRLVSLSLRRPRPGNALIKQQNPEMTDDQLAFSIAQMKQDGIVDSGDTLKLGIGAMTDARWQSFYDKMVHAGVVKPGLDYKRGYTLQFVNKGVGVELRPK